MRGEKGKLIVNGTPTQTPTIPAKTLIQPIKLNPNDKITISANNTVGVGTSANYVSLRFGGTLNGVYNDNIFDIVCTSANAKKTFTVTNATVITKVLVRGNANITFNNFTLKPQLELGSTATTYEPHQGKELTLDLPVENLFNKNNAEKYTGFTNGSDYKVNYNTAIKSIIIPCKENTTYTVSKINGGNYDRFNIASFTTKPTTGTIASKYVGDNSLTSLTITTGPNDTYIMVLYYHTSETVYSENDILDSIQIEKGSKANAYTPYGTTPIELCKIGNYQDYFYKSGSKWYLHKEIGKIVLDGSQDEAWNYRSDGRFDLEIPSVDGSYVITALSNRYEYYENWDTHLATNYSFTIRNGNWGTNKCRISFINNNFTITSTFRTELATNNVSVYYAKTTELGGATDTEITNTTLISQLEAIYNAPLYEQTNITQTKNDLPMVLDITACKDNINGIKAFIRK